ncbi:MAG: type II toxin-antitoxin system Phd/YefM family antitoxin [Anaerolineae bacterium]
MPEVGIKELKAHASEIVREVRENRARYVVSHRGKPVAVLVPIDSPEAEEKPSADEARAAWDEFFRLGKEIDKQWKSEKTSTEIISEMRR